MFLRCGAIVAALLVSAVLVGGASADSKGWGEPAPVPAETADNPAWEKYDFELPLADGTGKLSFRDLARSGDPFVIVWWLTDCPVCHLQMPFIQKLQSMVEKDGLELKVVSICVDDDSTECLNYIKEKGISFPVLLDKHARKTDATYRIRDLGTPSTYVFKGGGEYVDYLTGFKNSYPSTILKMLGITASSASEIRATREAAAAKKNDGADRREKPTGSPIDD